MTTLCPCLLGAEMFLRFAFERERLLGSLIGRVSNDSFMLLEQCSGGIF